MNSLLALFEATKNDRRCEDIGQHLPTLRRVAGECNTALEIGVRGGCSTIGIAAGLYDGIVTRYRSQAVFVRYTCPKCRLDCVVMHSHRGQRACGYCENTIVSAFFEKVMVRDADEDVWKVLTNCPFESERIFNSLPTFPVLDSLDISDCENTGIRSLVNAQGISGKFTRADSLTFTPSQSYDLVFIDTLHTYLQLKAELDRYSNFANKYIALHDTEPPFKYQDETENPDSPHTGLRWAVKDFIQENAGKWYVKEHHAYCHGMTILAKGSGEDCGEWINAE